MKLVSVNPEIYSSEVLEDFYSQDKANALASRINRQYSAYTLSIPLHQHYAIYGAGAPFERLFFCVRRQLEAPILMVSSGNERKEREFYASVDQRFDDFNFIELYCDTQHVLRCARNQLSDAE
jgi:hypothetical protein